MTNTEYRTYSEMKQRIAYLFLTEAPKDNYTHKQIVTKIGNYSYGHGEWKRLAGIRKAMISAYTDAHLCAYWSRMEWRLKDPHTGQLFDYFTELSFAGKKLYQEQGCPDIGHHYYKGTRNQF